MADRLSVELDDDMVMPLYHELRRAEPGDGA